MKQLTIAECLVFSLCGPLTADTWLSTITNLVGFPLGPPCSYSQPMLKSGFDCAQDSPNLPADRHWEKEEFIKPGFSRKPRLQPSSGWCNTARLHPEWKRMHQSGVNPRTADSTWKRKYLSAFTSIQVWFPEHLHDYKRSQKRLVPPPAQ